MLVKELMDKWAKSHMAMSEFDSREENPIGSKNLLFRRTTDRYGKKGTISSNRGYLRISRDIRTGRFIPRSG